MKMDSHIHITPPDIIRDYKKIGEKEPYFRLLSETKHNKFATYEQVAQHLKDSQFDHGVVFGFAFQDMGLCRYVNDYTIEAIRNHPELIGFMVLPIGHKEMEKEQDPKEKGITLGGGGFCHRIRSIANSDLRQKSYGCLTLIGPESAWVSQIIF